MLWQGKKKGLWKMLSKPDHKHKSISELNKRLCDLRLAKSSRYLAKTILKQRLIPYRKGT
jgi:hypothetical protein